MFGFFTSVLSSISGILTHVGEAVVAIANTLTTHLPRVGESMIKVGQVILEVAKAISLSPEEETVDEIGYKAIQEDTRPIEEGESISEYLEYLRKDVKVNMDELEHMSEDQMNGIRAVGTAIISQGIKEKTGVDISGDFLVEMAKMGMSSSELKELIARFSDNGISSMDTLSEFISGDLSDKERSEIYDIIADAERSINPEATENDILDKIESWTILDEADTKIGSGLSMEEKDYIREMTGWSDKILDHIGSMAEANIYMKANLVESMVGDRPALIRQDIDWSAFNCRQEWLKEKFADIDKWTDYNNADLIGEGFPPRDSNGDAYELHHIGQKQDSPYAELTWAEHMGDGNNTILHKMGEESVIDRGQFEKEKSDYWQDRFKAMPDSELEEIYRK